jgi:predicted acetyltransferase
VTEDGRIDTETMSIGMFVMEKHRRRGVAANILQQLKEIARAQARKPVSGCWYYNHNSKKSMETAGGQPWSRLLRFYF